MNLLRPKTSPMWLWWRRANFAANRSDGLRKPGFQFYFCCRQKISTRNIIPGKVTSLKKDPVSSSVTLEIAPGVEIVSSITSGSAVDLKLK